ncbi:cobalt-precorrin 5A hydrolase [Lentilactobacillus raoultii]|uniref:Cobalt-precorrin 5A hydrolase n=1 Tax=Lentilactobacillus raoultii TaxID=1987503 RepID=A0ABW3PGB1_9LACO|nr:cobalt-precorrin 5A hydrolase [Lentilactobacillus raoultii]
MSKNNSGQIAIIALTQIGAKLANHLHTRIANSELYLPEKYANNNDYKFGKGEFKSTCQELFGRYDGIVCIMATGIVVRTISPLIKDKLVDPAVIVIDELGNHVISLLSGHVGHANEWTKKIAKILESDPVITTATDTEQVQALDTLAGLFDGWYPDFKYYTKLINARLAEKKPVEIYVESEFKDDSINLSGFTEISSVTERNREVPLVIISDKDFYKKEFNCVQLVPRINILGIGARKAVSYSMIQDAFIKFCDQYHLLWHSFCEVASIEKKQHENAIHYLADTLNIPAKFYMTAQLKKIATDYPQSAFVERTVGIGNVSQAAADFAAGRPTFTKKFSSNEITLAASRKNLKRGGC